jgi:NAD(P)-dependent dehydrogenase (short-subunit alcohol dehydrogenase family)
MNVNELFSLEGKVAIVTGACGLLGKHHCRALSEAGANIVVADISTDDSRGFAEELGQNNLGISMDVANPESIKRALQRIMDKYNRIDVLVNNAAVNNSFENPSLAKEESMFEHYPLSSWNQSWRVNVSGVFLCSQAFGSVMANQESGSIINIASTYGVVAPDQSIYQDEKGNQVFYKSPVYPVTKSAVLGFTRYLAAYWGNKKVRVNALSPGGVENHQDDFFIRNYSKKTLLNRMAVPDDYKGALVFLASDASAYMTGANLIIDGGWTAI